MFQTFPGEGDPATWFVGRGRQKQPFLSNVSSLVVVPGTVPSGGQPAENRPGVSRISEIDYIIPRPKCQSFFRKIFRDFCRGERRGNLWDFLTGNGGDDKLKTAENSGREGLSWREPEKS